MSEQPTNAPTPHHARSRSADREKAGIATVVALYGPSRFELESAAPFADASGPRALAAALPAGTAWSHGVALDLLRRGALRDLLCELDAADGPGESKLGAFVRAHYLEHQSIAQISSAGVLGRTYCRTHVSKTVAAQAKLLVAYQLRRLLDAHQPLDVSPGVRAELDAFVRRRRGA